MKISLNAIVGALAFQIALAGSLHASEIEFADHSAYQENTPYGSLIFNRDAETVGENRRYKRFIEVERNGEVELPQQDGYCFYLNHYREVNSGGNFSYDVVDTKTYDDGEVHSFTVTSKFTPTSWLGSRKGPDYCVESLRGVVKVELKFSSAAGRAFSWEVHFQRQPY